MSLEEKEKNKSLFFQITSFGNVIRISFFLFVACTQINQTGIEGVDETIFKTGKTRLTNLKN